MAQFEFLMTTDLKRGSSQVQVLHGQTFSQDNLGNRVGVVVLDGGEPATLSGTVTGYVIRADGGTVVVVGALDGNKAYIDLPESAYAVPGQIQIAIRLTSGSTKTVLGAMTAYVQRTATGTIIDPGHVIPDIDDIIAKMDEMDEAIANANAATAAANTAAQNANNATGYIAPSEASSTASAAHAQGSYLIYDGTLYQATADIAIGDSLATTGTGANIAQVTGGVTGEVADLKSAFVNNKKGILNPFDMVADSYVSTNGTITPYVGWKRTDYTYIGDCVSLVAKTSASSQYNCFYNAEKTFISKFTVGTSDTNIAVPSNAAYVIFSNTNAGMDNLTVSFVTKDHKDLNTLKNTVNEINNLRYINIDETQFVTGYINSTGGISSNDAYKTSPYLRCAMKRIKFNCLVGTGMLSVAFYSDEDEDSFISGYENAEALSEHPTHVMNVPEATKYIRISKNIVSSYVGDDTPFVISEDAIEQVLERIASASDTANEALYKIEHIDPSEILDDVYYNVYSDVNLIDASEITLHSVVRNDNGEIKVITNTEAADYIKCSSDYIPVRAGETLYLSGDNFNYSQAFGWYNSEKTYLGGKDTYGGMNYHLHVASVQVPSGAAYLRITFHTEADAASAWADYTGAEPTGEVINATYGNYIDYHYYPFGNPCDYNGEEISVFNKIVCIGDSITSGYFNAASNSQSIAKYAYPAFLQKLTGVETTNKGDAGETSVSWWAAHSSDDFSGYDCAIINLGINDVLTSVSEADTRSAFASIISALKTANTGIKIFIANINPAYSRGNTTYDAINEVIEDIATTTENCYFIDLTQYGHAVGVAYADGHLTACGYLRLAQDYKAAISWIIKNDPVGFRYVQFIGTNLQPAT